LERAEKGSALGCGGGGDRSHRHRSSTGRQRQGGGSSRDHGSSRRLGWGTREHAGRHRGRDHRWRRWVEFDVQEIADGTVVVWHDSDFKRIAGVDRKIWEVTTEELRDIDIGSWFSPEFKDQRVPTLAEVLDLCKGKIKLNIELKYYGHNDRLEEKVIEQVEAAGLASDVVLMSLKQELVERAQDLRPDWPVGLLTAVALGDLTKLEVDFYAVATSIATRRFIRNVHGLDREVYVWTVNEPVQMAAMMGLGIDNLITDEPALARSVLEERAEMNQIERLILLIAGRFGIVPPREGPSTEADA
jgi:glycerophosphoryl diester phosphodiesterase